MGLRLPFEIRHTAEPPWEQNPGEPCQVRSAPGGWQPAATTTATAP